jgi:Zn-dependent peptidase ImmA (M78 family)
VIEGLESLAQALEEMLDEKTRRDLAILPAKAVRALGLTVLPFALPSMGDPCSCDGAFWGSPRPTIAYRPTPGSRRENFTILHEVGHHLVRGNVDVLSALADIGTDGGLEAEERVCHLFASRILLPKVLLDQILVGQRPQADHAPRLYEASNASREACAVALANRLGCFGYVVLAEVSTSSVRFAASSPECPYVWRRGSKLRSSHNIWRAVQRDGGFRGEGPVEWAGGSKGMWLDALAEGDLVYAVFAQERNWAAPGLNLLEGGVTSARPIALSGTCAHCGEATWGYQPCEKCGDVRCRKCDRCGCGAPSQATRQCPRCHLARGPGLFRKGSSICVDCE